MCTYMICVWNNLKLHQHCDKIRLYRDYLKAFWECVKELKENLIKKEKEILNATCVEDGLYAPHIR